MAIIYAKTPDGQNEIETRARRLAPRGRSALILVDGKRSDDDLSKLIPNAAQTLQELLDAGLIEAVRSVESRSSRPAEAVAAQESGVAPAAAAPAVDLATLRREAVRAINDQLGPQGEALALKLERATNMDECRAVLERAVAFIASARGGGAAAQFASRFLKSSDG